MASVDVTLRLLLLGSAVAACAVEDAPIEPLPATLAATGIGGPGVHAFVPQYPLWTDGARKPRWIYLPPGAVIDGRDADAWQLPVGTKLWKQFAFDRRAETRFMERTREGWRYATYVWSASGDDAVLAPAAGAPTSATLADGRVHHAPSEPECRLCHADDRPVLAFTALQLSPDRDPEALHAEPRPPGAIDLTTLVASGVLVDYTASVAPRIAARSSVERAALGYLHGNCGSCHRDGGAAASVGIILAQPVAGRSRVRSTTIDVASQFTTAAAEHRIAAGAPDRSVLVTRVRARTPALQMPPLGTQLVDADAVAQLSRWIDQLPDLAQGDLP